MKPSKLKFPFIASHFLDSGSFTLRTRSKRWAAETGNNEWDFYKTDEFYEYLDSYAAFVKKHAAGIDIYASVDAIPNPEVSWTNLKYLESKHGLSPIPVVHYGTDVSWLKKYIEEGYDLIAIGGLVGQMSTPGCQRWIDDCFDLVCDNPERLPTVKLHGFGLTVYNLIFRYPWWSIDSTTWLKEGGYGRIIMPHKRRGEFIYNERYHILNISNESPRRKSGQPHYSALRKLEKSIVHEWLDLIGMKLGKTSDDGTVIEDGVTNNNTHRYVANIKFFERMRLQLPKWPWAFHLKKRKGLGIL